MNEIIKSLDEITIDWLAQILRKRYSITSQEIKGFQIKKNWNSTVSGAAIIEINYKKNKLDLPESLFIKITKSNLPEELKGFGEKEVRFYNEVAPKCEQSLILFCYFAQYDETNKIFNLVFEDLSRSHYVTEWPIPPTFENCNLAIECLARIQSFWWDHQDLQNIVAEFPTKKMFIVDFNDFVNNDLQNFIDFMGDRLTEKRKEIMKRYIDNFEILIDRFMTFKNITLIQKDAHFWNFLFPIKKEDPIKIIDWQVYSYGLATDDLAYMIAMHWYPDRRKEFEFKLLKNYHNVLLKNGISNYTFDDLIMDYKRSVIKMLFTPVEFWSKKINAEIWWSHLERIMLAFEDLNCIELLN